MMYKIYINIYVHITVHYQLYSILYFMFFYAIMFFKNTVVLEDYQESNPSNVIQPLDLSNLPSEFAIWQNLSRAERREYELSSLGVNQDIFIKVIKNMDNLDDLVNFNNIILKFVKSDNLDYVSDISQWENMNYKNYDNYAVDTTFKKFLLYILCSISIIYLVYNFFPFMSFLFDSCIISYKYDMISKIMLMEENNVHQLCIALQDSYLYIKYIKDFKL